MDFGTLPPEVNSGRMYAGTGSGPMMAAAAAWDSLAAELHSVGSIYESVLAELANGWMGPSASTMATSAEPYVAWMHDTAAQAEHTASKAKSAAAAFETAHAATVPPPVISANRSQLSSLVSSNLLGQNTPAIAATEANYGQMWAQDATAMYGYAGNSSTASSVTPFRQPPQTTNQAGSGNQAAAAGQSTAGAAGSQAQTAMSAVPQAMQSLTSPAAAGSGVSALAAPFQAVGLDPGISMAFTGMVSSLFGALVIDSAGSFGIDSAGSFGIDLIGVDLAQAFGGAAVPQPPMLVNAASAPPVAASMGQASPVGGLSVPKAWTVAAPPPVQQVSTGTTLAASGAEAAPVVAASRPGLPLAEMATAGLAGRATAAGRGRRNEKSLTTKNHLESQQKPPNGRITAIAPELRELAELRDSGIITGEEFDEQKRRMLEQ